MIQAPADQRGLVDEIVATLVSRFHPRRVYLFGSRARGDARPDSDYDFLIEIDQKPEDAVITRQGMTWLSDFRESEVQVHVRYPGQLDRRKDDPGTVDWDVIREGKLLYALEGLPPILPEPPALRIRECRPLPPGILEAWLKTAERDLYHARFHLADPGEWAKEICFLSQQSAEKFLKALLVAYRLLPMRTHDLRKLLEELRSVGVLVPKIREDCALLSRYAVAPRYPDFDPEWGDNDNTSASVLSGRDALQAIEAVERIAATVRAELP